MIKLEPCPFCGGTNLASPPGQAMVYCGDCGASGPIGLPHPIHASLTYAAGASKWNERTALAAEKPSEQPQEER